MSAVINTNMAAIRTHGVYNRNNTEMNAAMTRVATAQKVNSVRDNASDWAISEKMRERIRSLNQASQNVQNDTAMMKTASGALGNTIDILKTLKERAVNAANDSNQDSDRKKIQAEIGQLLEQIDNNSKVQFNGKYLLNGSASEPVAAATKSVSYWEGTHSTKLQDIIGYTASEDSKAVLSWTDDDGSHSVEATGITKGTKLSEIFDEFASVTGAPTTFKVVGLTGTTAGTSVSDGSNDVTIEDGSTVLKTTKTGLYAIATTAGMDGAVSGVKIEISGGGTGTVTLDFSESLQEAKDKNETASPLTFQYGDDSSLQMDVSINNMNSKSLGIAKIDVSTKANAKSAMSTIDTALNNALNEQTKLGSIESRLGYTADNLSTQIENLEASDSAIRDADMAKEMTNYMKWSVLSQASQYMLAQAGQNAFQVLNLLQP